MKIQALHSNFVMPRRGSAHAAGFDLHMPEAGSVKHGETIKVGLGFATEVPPGFMAVLLPRSGVGSKQGLELNNTAGIIDSDYRGQWFATLHVKQGEFSWNAGDKLLQFILVPVHVPRMDLVESLDNTERGTGGLGSTGT